MSAKPMDPGDIPNLEGHPDPHCSACRNKNHPPGVLGPLADVLSARVGMVRIGPRTGGILWAGREVSRGESLLGNSRRDATFN